MHDNLVFNIHLRQFIINGIPVYNHNHLPRQHTRSNHAPPAILWVLAAGQKREPHYISQPPRCFHQGACPNLWYLIKELGCDFINFKLIQFMGSGTSRFRFAMEFIAMQRVNKGPTGKLKSEPRCGLCGPLEVYFSGNF